MVLPAGSVHHNDATTRGGIEVDVIHTDSGAANHLEMCAGLENRRGYLCLAAHDDGAEPGDCLHEFRLALAGAHNDFESVAPGQLVNAALRNGIGDKDFHFRKNWAGAASTHFDRQLHRFSHREADGEAGAAVREIARSDGAAVNFHQLLRDRQPEA